jgi:hypothetical protein
MHAIKGEIFLKNVSFKDYTEIKTKWVVTRLLRINGLTASCTANEKLILH